MELFQMMQNIRNLDKETEIKETIETVRYQLQGLTEERTCKIYSGYIINELKKRHIPARLVSTTDLGFAYEHQFVLVPTDESAYFVIDLTIAQFNQSVGELYENGYEKMNDLAFNTYLKIVTLGEKDDIFSMNDIFYLPEENKVESKK